MSGFQIAVQKFSPRTWGCFYTGTTTQRDGYVLPTYVGVFLRHWPISWVRISSPHIRGGVSQPRLLLLSLLQFSPHTWGCFYSTEFKRDLARVLPTYVGVFLVSEEGSIELKRFSQHTWGCFPSSVTAMFSPRAWGCCVLSTCVGLSDSKTHHLKKWWVFYLPKNFC